MGGAAATRRTAPQRRARNQQRRRPAHGRTGRRGDGRKHGLALRLGARFADSAQKRQPRPLPPPDRARQTRPDRRAANGERFTNEGAPYYNFIRDLFAAAPTTGPVCAWLLCDHAFIRRYGLGAVKPFPFPMDGWLANGYLQRAQTPEELAQRCDIDPTALRRTIDEYNRHAEHGEDPQFGRGGNLYQRNQGDPDHRPNPCVAPLAQAPYYAVKVVPGSLGTFRGILIDEHARVLRADGSAIPNLYAAGNDANSIFGGYYPSGGITLGPAMTFGYLAANTIAGEHSNAPENPL